MVAVVKQVKSDAKPAEGTKGAKAPKEKKVRTPKAKVVKPDFSLASAANSAGEKIALDEKGRLTAVPQNWTPDFNMIAGKAFGSRSIKLGFKAHVLGFTITRLQEKQRLLLERASKPSARVQTPEKRLAKLKKLQAQMAELEAALKAEGVSV